MNLEDIVSEEEKLMRKLDAEIYEYGNEYMVVTKYGMGALINEYGIQRYTIIESGEKGKEVLINYGFGKSMEHVNRIEFNKIPSYKIKNKIKNYLKFVLWSIENKE